MIFRKYTRKSNNCEFFMDNENIEIVQSYKYSTTRISPTGTLTLALDHLKEKSVHVLFSIRKHTNFSRLKPHLASNIFDTMISPISTCNYNFANAI